MSNSIIVVLCVSISMVLWRLLTGRWSTSARRSRRTSIESTGVPAVMRIPVPWVFILTYVAGIAANLVIPVRLPSVEMQRLGLWTGLAILALGLPIAIAALRLFHQSSTTTVPFETPARLVVSGPYRFSRNPMYVGLTLIYAGVACTRGEIWPLVVLPLTVLYVDRVVIPVEEHRLLQVFGEDYRAFCSHIRRWL